MAATNQATDRVLIVWPPSIHDRGAITPGRYLANGHLDT